MRSSSSLQPDVHAHEDTAASEWTVAALAALAHPHRLALFRHLVERGDEGRAAGDLAADLGLPPSSLSFHLGQLHRAGLIDQRRAGRSLFYSTNVAAMDGLIAYLTDNCCGGTPCGARATTQGGN